MFLYNSIEDSSPSLFQIVVIDKLKSFFSQLAHISFYLTKAIALHYSLELAFFDNIVIYL